MTKSARSFLDYKATLRLFYEEEVAGAAYFARLAEFFDGRPRQALLLLAKMEVVVATTIAPLLARHGLIAADAEALQASGRQEAEVRRGVAWPELVAAIITDFPAFLDEFAEIERLAPEADRKLIDVFTPHEVATIEFAQREAVGDPDSLAPLEAFLERYEVAGQHRS